MSGTISIITPTFERHAYIQKLLGAVLAQDFVGKWEWLIGDMSDKPLALAADARVKYFHFQDRISIGKARNFLIGKAKGEIIAHFDDDDYYSPAYLSTVYDALKESDFFNFFSWFNYDVKTNQIYYWATDEEGETQFVLDPLTGMRTREIDFGTFLKKEAKVISKNGFRGYGFSYAYSKEVAKKCRFPDKNLREDTDFYKKVEEKGFRMNLLPEQKGLVIKVVHDSNISFVYPQYRLPAFLLKQLFPDFCDYLKSYPSLQDQYGQ